MAAKPIIDIDLIVANSAAESCYLTELEDRLILREPFWHQHRIRWSPAQQQFVACTDNFPGLSYGADWPAAAVRGLQDTIRRHLVAQSNLHPITAISGWPRFRVLL